MKEENISIDISDPDRLTGTICDLLPCDEWKCSTCGLGDDHMDKFVEGLIKWSKKNG